MLKRIIGFLFLLETKIPVTSAIAGAISNLLPTSNHYGVCLAKGHVPKMWDTRTPILSARQREMLFGAPSARADPAARAKTEPRKQPVVEAGQLAGDDPSIMECQWVYNSFSVSPSFFLKKRNFSATFHHVQELSDHQQLLTLVQFSSTIRANNWASAE